MNQPNPQAPTPLIPSDLLRRVVAIVALLNFGYFFVEFAVALAAGSVSLSPTASTSSKTPPSTC